MTNRALSSSAAAAHRGRSDTSRLEDMLDGTGPMTAAFSQEVEALRDHDSTRRHLQDLPQCFNFIELSFATFIGGQTFCGHFAATLDPDVILAPLICPEMTHDGQGHLGGQLCPHAHMCDAIFGYCQNPPVGTMNPGETTEIVVSAAMSQVLSNTPEYHTFEMIEGRTYRFRAWSENLKAIALILVDPTGYPIRRSISGGGRTTAQYRRPEYKSHADVNNVQRDAMGGCNEDLFAQIIYKATETATYQVGIGHMIGASNRREGQTMQETDRQRVEERTM
jgi:hypothetical protein